MPRSKPRRNRRTNKSQRPTDGRRRPTTDPTKVEMITADLDSLIGAIDTLLQMGAPTKVVGGLISWHIACRQAWRHLSPAAKETAAAIYFDGGSLEEAITMARLLG